MFSRTAIVLFLVLFLVGCATTATTPKNQAQQLQNQVKELQNRISFLEQELQIKGREINELENELEGTPTGSITTAQLSVKQVQTALKNADFYKGVVDGKLGSQTKSAIKRFQKAHGLKADGVIGKKTTAELTQYLK